MLWILPKQSETYIPLRSMNWYHIYLGRIKALIWSTTDHSQLVHRPNSNSNRLHKKIGWKAWHISQRDGSAAATLWGILTLKLLLQALQRNQNSRRKHSFLPSTITSKRVFTPSGACGASGRKRQFSEDRQQTAVESQTKWPTLLHRGRSTWASRERSSLN